MTPLRLLGLAMAMLPLVACVAQVDDLTPEERALLDDDLVEESQQELTACDYDKAKGDALGAKARSGSGSRSQSRCYRYVKRHLQNAGYQLPSELWSYEYGNSAADFTKFAIHKSSLLDRMGLRPIAVGPNEKPPQGTILVWPRGVAGFSKKHGHIEIVCNAESTQACSDFKGRIRTGRGTPAYYAPKGTCNTNPDSCEGKSDGYYCSGINQGSAFSCRGGVTAGATYCAEAGKKCGTAGARATVSGGKLQCN